MSGAKPISWADEDSSEDEQPASKPVAAAKPPQRATRSSIDWADDSDR
jgi:hypothetical protein